MTRVGDAALLLGMGRAVGEHGQRSSCPSVFAHAGALPAAVVTAAAVCLLLGAVGKSAQFPLHVWLPDAMEGPTPVSALIHAATMVAAGVFLVARTWPLFELSPTARTVALVLGAVTALGAATIAVAQTDIKKVLAYSTISQLGFMFAALGVGAWRVAIFHLVTHAAFKSLLFLASGSVIHGSGHAGPARDGRPVETHAGDRGDVGAGFAGAGGHLADGRVLQQGRDRRERAARRAVGGDRPAGGQRAHRRSTSRAPRSSPSSADTAATSIRTSPRSSMTVPLIVLAAASCVLGFAGAAILETLGGEAEPLSVTVAAIALALAAAGAIVGWLAVGA